MALHHVYVIQSVTKKQKNSALKCYLSKTNVYKEDPHWYGVTGFLTGVGDHEVAELLVESNYVYLGYGELLVVLLLLVAGRNRCNLFLSSFVVME